MRRFHHLFAAALLLSAPACTFFPDPNQAKVDERNSLSKKIAGAQAEKGLNDAERASLSQMSSLLASGKPFDGNKISNDVAGIEAAVARRSVTNAGQEIEKDRREKYLFRHPKTTPAVRDLIMQGKVAAGMTTDEVVASWGEPSRKYRPPGDKNAPEQWIYTRETYLYFEGGKVTTLRGWRQ